MIIRKQKKLIKQLIIGTVLLLIVGSQADLKACEIIIDMKETVSPSYKTLTFESGYTKLYATNQLDIIESTSGLFVKLKECAVAYSLIEKK